MSKGFLKFGLCIILALMVSGCANEADRQGRIAVVNWDKAVKAHPLDSKLETGEKIVKDLLERRKNQENIARAQMESLGKLQMLKKISEENYHLADINTRMLQMQAYENDKLQKQMKIFESEADEILAEHKNAIEKDYQLEIFNLELALKNVHMKKEQKSDIEAQIASTKATRDMRLAQLQQEKNIIVAEKAMPYLEDVKNKLAKEQTKLEKAAASEMSTKANRDAKLIESAPNSLKQALAIMDREIDKQQDKNSKLRKEISSDIENSATALAKQRGYEVVLNKFKVNIKADDITDDVISDLKKIKKDNR